MKENVIENVLMDDCTSLFCPQLFFGSSLFSVVTVVLLIKEQGIFFLFILGYCHKAFCLFF